MANNGTSPRIGIGGETLSAQKSASISPVNNEDIVAKPPEPVNDTEPSYAMYAYRNNDRDFIFQKISPPLYGDDGTPARYTGIPANEPDFIADFHYIGIMRSIDDMLRHRYSGYISGNYNTPGAG